MTLLASVVYPSLFLATFQVACSSSDNSTPAPTPFDSGAVAVPPATPAAGSVTFTVAGKGVLVSSEGFPSAKGPNGFAGTDGGSPQVDCVQGSGACTASQGVVVYAIPAPGNVFLGWSVTPPGGAATIISTDANFQVTPGSGSAVTATFAAASTGPVPPPPTPVIVDAGTGGG